MTRGNTRRLRVACAALLLCGAATVVAAADETAASGAPGPMAEAAGTAEAPAEAGPGAGAVRPRTRWEHRDRHPGWNRGALQALRTHGRALVNIVPRDIGFWCPGYGAQDAEGRSHFWVGFLSALAKHESTYRPDAVGGGGRWFGLLQIYPGTARSYDCKARSGDALKDGAANLSCAVRIMAATVARDGVIQGKAGRWLGVSADWGPLRSTGKRREMAEWLRAQPYCRVPDRERADAGPPDRGEPGQ